MAAVFMFSTCTMAVRTGFLPRWIAFTGIACGLVLLLAIANYRLIWIIFPLWILLVSLRILVADIAGKRTSALAA
jgi:hypothetical protein